MRLFPPQSADAPRAAGRRAEDPHALPGVRPGRRSPRSRWRGPRTPLVGARRRRGTRPPSAVPYLTPAACRTGSRLPCAGRRRRSTGTTPSSASARSIDEYGWRHFGDIYGDHEAVYHTGPGPLVSHYNNQYDTVAGGFGYQFLRSGDPRWLTMMERAGGARRRHRHLSHRPRDKCGLQPRPLLAHRITTSTPTRRPTARIPPRQGRRRRACRGSTLYTTGLMLHYFLTGDAAARRAVARLGAVRHRQSTTAARRSSGISPAAPPGTRARRRSDNYHGPGRGAGERARTRCSTAHRLTGRRRFLDKAEELIRRCIHPDRRHRALGTCSTSRSALVLYDVPAGRSAGISTSRRESGRVRRDVRATPAPACSTTRAGCCRTSSRISTTKPSWNFRPRRGPRRTCARATSSFMPRGTRRRKSARSFFSAPSSSSATSSTSSRRCRHARCAGRSRSS